MRMTFSPALEKGATHDRNSDREFRDIAAEAIEQLRGAVRGTVITPDDPGYDTARTVYNAMIDKRPALIVQCVDVADVMQGVTFAGDATICPSACAAAATTPPDWAPATTASSST